MPSARILAASGAAAAGVVGVPAVAHACVPCTNTGIYVLPNADVVEPPVNVLIWVDGYVAQAAPLRLLDGEGREVEVLEHRINVARMDATMVVLEPAEPLDPSATYSVTLDGDIISELETGSATDDVAPSPPTPIEHGIVDTSPGSMCGEARYAWFEFSDPSLIYVLDWDDTATVGQESLSGDVAQIRGDAQLALGFGRCSYNWLDVEPGDQATVRFGAFDLAGNFSGWSPEHEVMFPPDEGCNCRALPSSGPPGVAANVLLLALMRRRVRDGSRA